MGLRPRPRPGAGTEPRGTGGTVGTLRGTVGTLRGIGGTLRSRRVLLRFTRDDRRRRSRRLRQLEHRLAVRLDLVPEQRALWLGTLHLRPLVVGQPLGLDLDRRRALGVRAVPLWP